MFTSMYEAFHFSETVQTTIKTTDVILFDLNNYLITFLNEILNKQRESETNQLESNNLTNCSSSTNFTQRTLSYKKITNEIDFLYMLVNMFARFYKYEVNFNFCNTSIEEQYFFGILNETTLDNSDIKEILSTINNYFTETCNLIRQKTFLQDDDKKKLILKYRENLLDIIYKILLPKSTNERYIEYDEKIIVHRLYNYAKNYISSDNKIFLDKMKFNILQLSYINKVTPVINAIDKHTERLKAKKEVSSCSQEMLHTTSRFWHYKNKNSGDYSLFAIESPNPEQQQNQPKQQNIPQNILSSQYMYQPQYQNPPPQQNLPQQNPPQQNPRQQNPRQQQNLPEQQYLRNRV